ncbi:MAG: LysE family translocator [Thermomicrobiales bacterium]
MVDASTLGAFLVAGFLLVVIPGPNVMYIVARGIHQGRPAALASAFGVEVGSLVHVAAATVGLSALLVSSAVAFSVVKYVGAGYLFYLGLRTLLARNVKHELTAPAPDRLRRVFSQGVLINVLNPKTAIFFFAFLPQFIDPDRGSVAEQTLLFGILLVAMGVCSDVVYGLLAGSLGGWLRRHARALAAQRYVAGAVYLGLGLATALADVRQK